MERIAGMFARSEGAGEESVHFAGGGEVQGLMMTAPVEGGSSFTALLELPANQAMELLHSPDSGGSFDCSPTFPSDAALIERAAKFSIFAPGGGNGNGNGGCCGGGGESTETNSIPSNSTVNSQKPKSEPADSEWYRNASPSLISDPTVQKSAKRKEREKKVKPCAKKSKKVENESTEEAAKLPYVHVRARRGQATDSHSLAERVRREKINARMKLLQELVPGCSKITGTASVLDEIINHVQSLQRQVEILSMRLAAVNPRIDFNLDSLLAAESASQFDSNFSSMVMPFMWSDLQLGGIRQHYQQLWHMDPVHQPVYGRGDEDNFNFMTPENSLLSYDSSANSASLHSNQLKMEL